MIKMIAMGISFINIQLSVPFYSVVTPAFLPNKIVYGKRKNP